jgi:hypothetical protein
VTTRNFSPSLRANDEVRIELAADLSSMDTLVLCCRAGRRFAAARYHYPPVRQTELKP